MPTFFRMRKTCDLDTPNSFATSLADWSALYRAMISATNGNFPVGLGVLLMCSAKAPHCLSHKSRLVLPITAVGFASIKVCARLNG